MTNALELYAKELEEAARRKSVVGPPPASSMPEEFSNSTMLALKAQQDILTMELDDEDPHFKAKLAAKASVSSQQISAQLKADDQRLKAHSIEVSYYDELSKALREYQEKRGK
jgi:hypothetical protein